MKNTRSRAALIGIAVTSYVFMCGSRGSCDRRAPTLTCDSPSISVLPGTCTTLENPCADHLWYNLPRIDGFQLCDEPATVCVDAAFSIGTDTLPSTQDLSK